MGNSLCKKQISDETKKSKDLIRSRSADVIPIQQTQPDKNSNDNIEYFKQVNTNTNRIKDSKLEKSTKNTKSFLTDSALKRKTTSIGNTYYADVDCETEMSSNDIDTEGDIDSGIEIHTSRSHLGDKQTARSLIESSYHGNEVHIGTDYLTKDCNNANQTHSESLCPNSTNINEENSDKKIRVRHAVRRHQSLPPAPSIITYSHKLQKRIVLPGVVSERDEKYNYSERFEDSFTEQKIEENHSLKGKEYSTADPKNRPGAARGTRTRPKSFNVRPKVDDRIAKTGSNDRPVQVKRSNTDCNMSTGATPFYNFTHRLQEETSDIQIQIKRTGVRLPTDAVDQSRHDYEASIAIAGAGSSERMTLKQHRNIQMNKNRLLGCKARIKVSTFSNICEITLPKNIMGILNRQQSSISRTSVVDAVPSSQNDVNVRRYAHSEYV